MKNIAQIKLWLTLVMLGLLSACQALIEREEKNDNAKNITPAFASTYKVPKSEPILIRHAQLLDGTGNFFADADVLVRDGKIQQIGTNLTPEASVKTIEAKGKWLTPGLIDVHSHMGVYPSLSIDSLADGNEIVGPNTAEVWAEHGVWPQDPTFEKAIAGGVTTVQILPGSANLFGGRGVVLKNVPSVRVMGMKFPDAPYSLKMACGENPKRVYGKKGGPYTRMGNMAGYRKAWIDAQAYLKQWEKWKKDKTQDLPKRDLRLETLAGVLKGEIRIHNHCYRADEMANMIALSKEFGYKISAFHHAVEAYKIADLLAENNICAVMWADWWGFKQEAFDMVQENIALVDKAKACAVLHSDDAIQIQRLPQEAAKVIGAANRAGMKVNRKEAIRWLTINPAKSLGLDDKIGSIEVGKNADIVLWDKDPFSVYAKAEKVWIDGALRYDIAQPSVRPTSDFNLGLPE